MPSEQTLLRRAWQRQVDSALEVLKSQSPLTPDGQAQIIRSQECYRIYSQLLNPNYTRDTIQEELTYEPNRS